MSCSTFTVRILIDCTNSVAKRVRSHLVVFVVVLLVEEFVIGKEADLTANQETGEPTSLWQ